MGKLSPLAARRWEGFRSNRRGSISCLLFIILFVTTLLAELLANDKPLLIRTDDGWFTPAVTTYVETDFGGDFPTEPDYHDPYFAELIAGKNGWIVWPLIPYSYDTVVKTQRPAPSAPDAMNWLGTDDQSRDVLARLIYGIRISILFGLSLTGVSALVGILAGALQGYYGGWVDLGFQRFIEIWGGLPLLYLLIILASIITPNFWWLLGLLSLFSWMGLQGVVRAEVLKVRNFDYVRAARALGAGDWIIIRRHILPNAMVATITLTPFLLNSSMTILTSLDFLGFGLPPGSPSLGELLAQGKNNLQAPWLGITGFMVLSVLLTLLVFTGEAVRDAFDSRRDNR